MATIRTAFHEVGNWHNKISMAAIVTREVLTTKDTARLSAQELRKLLNKAVGNLNKIEQFVIGADESIGVMKPFIYEKMGADTEIPARSK